MKHTYANTNKIQWFILNLLLLFTMGIMGQTKNIYFNSSFNRLSTGSHNTAIGYEAFYSNTSGSDNTMCGKEALHFNTTGSNNTANGSTSLYHNSVGQLNTANGSYSLYKNTTGNENTASGSNSLFENTTGYENTATGASSLFYNTTGYKNTANGTRSLHNTTTGFQNTAIGEHALSSNTTGSNNTALGYNANSGAENLTNATAIGSNAIVTTSNAIQLGDDAVTQVFIGTEINATLITGGLQVLSGAAAGKVLTSDANGTGTWQTIPATSEQGWSLTGNTGTAEGTHFIGTSDAVPINIRVNNQKAGRIDFDTTKANTFYGYETAKENTTGSKNTANGFHALTYNTTGNGNTAIGNNALYFNATGSNNTALGNSADVGLENLTNATAIGYNALVSESNAIQLGDNHVTKVIAGFENNATFFAGKCVLGNTVEQPITMPAGYNLYVKNGILTESVKIALTNTSDWSDYVFANDYILQPLHAVEAFIKANKHLPGVLSAEQMVKEGNNLGATDAKLLEKIEELTLYLIDMKKEIETLKKENISLKSSFVNSKK